MNLVPVRNVGATIGLLGRDGDSGLGYQNAAIAENLRVGRWFVSFRNRRHRTLPVAGSTERLLVSKRDAKRRLKRLVAGLDCLLFAERPEVPEIVRIARQNGTSIACIPNWEHLSPDLSWIQSVDLMICPTWATFAMLCDWRDRYEFKYNVALVPWPIDVDRYRFRLRERCRSFLYVNGWGGCAARHLDGTFTHHRRKGLDTVLAAAALAPELRFIIQTQVPIDRAVPSNVEIRGRLRDNRGLYEHGDVCFQPSRWEGIGLPLLECQAAGMPLVTTNAPPMNEYEPLATVPVAGSEIVRLTSQPFIANVLDPTDAVRVLRSIHGESLTTASRRARQYVEEVHSWSIRGHQIRSALENSLGLVVR